MQVSEAALLIEGIQAGFSGPEKWADLGCGKGVFTRALSQLLPPGSEVIAVDKEEQALDGMATGETAVSFLLGDFEQAVSLRLPRLDGILMANALHYVRDKREVLLGLTSILTDPGRFVLIEYDNISANPWVPYPIGFNEARTLFASLGFLTEKLGERRSRYGGGTMYSCVARRREA